MANYFSDKTTIWNHRLLILLIFFSFTATTIVFGEEKNAKGETSIEEEVYGVKYASDCEVCKIMANELEDRFKMTGKTSDVIETGYTFDPEKRQKKKYSISELRFIESMDGLCSVLLEYNIHKERKDSSRFAKGMSSTFQTLHGLVDKGVKVDLGIPYDLWDKPSAEVTHLKTQCEQLIEKYEDDIEEWYFKRQTEVPLLKFLCEDRVLTGSDSSCLTDHVSRQNAEPAATPDSRRPDKSEL